MEVYGIAVFSFFSSGISLILISMCGIAVSSSPAVCGTRYFGICQVFLRYCGIGYPPNVPSFISDAIQFKHFLWLWLENSLHSSRVQECTLYFILFMLSFGAVISYYLLLFRPIATLQVAEIKNLLNFYSFPVALGQIYFVLVLISTAHNARYLYTQKWISPGLQNVL